MTPKPNPQTPNPTLFTLHPTPCTLNPNLCTRYKDKGLFRFMAKVVTGKGAAEFDWQAVAITMNAFAKALTHDPSTKTVFRHFTHQVKCC